MECEEGADMNFDDLVFVIDGIDYAMPSHHWNQRMIDENLTKGGTCVTSISQLDIFQDGQDNLFILGDTFMQVFYSVFDRDQDRVGLALAKHEQKELIPYWDTEGYLADVTELD